MNGIAVLLLLAIVYFPADVRAGCDDDTAKRVLSSRAVDCPAGVGIAAGRAYAPDGGRYRAVYIAYTDPATGITIYAQLVRGPRNPRRDNFDLWTPRYAVDVCIYGSEGPGHPLTQQIGGDESVSACCVHADDANDEDDDVACPEPPAYMLPMAAPAGQDEELEALAHQHLVETLTSDDYPWLGKWGMLREALRNTIVSQDVATLQRQGMDWVLDIDDEGRSMSSALAEGAAGQVRFYDGTVITAMPDADPPLVAQPRNHLSRIWRQLIVVSKRRAGGSFAYWCKFFGWQCEHSGTYAIRRTSSTWWSYAWQRCNHGGCPGPGYENYDPTMVPWCLFDTVNYNRVKHTHNVSCHTPYDPSGSVYGHVCNDDTELQYRAVRDNYHPYAGGYPCYDNYRHWTTTPCW